MIILSMVGIFFLHLIFLTIFSTVNKREVIPEVDLELNFEFESMIISYLKEGDFK